MEEDRRFQCHCPKDKPLIRRPAEQGLILLIQSKIRSTPPSRLNFSINLGEARYKLDNYIFHYFPRREVGQAHVQSLALDAWVFFFKNI